MIFSEDVNIMFQLRPVEVLPFHTLSFETLSFVSINFGSLREGMRSIFSFEYFLIFHSFT